MELKTPLYDCHVEMGGKIVPFGGYLLPVQYSGVIAEHTAVRSKAGLFDVSHMGEVFVSGKDALANLNNLMTNDFTDMTVGQARYSLMCNENGGVVDDLIVYKLGEESYLVVVNASNREKDFNWMKEHSSGDAVFVDRSDDIGLLALQGPLAEAILKKGTDEALIPTQGYHFVEKGVVCGVPCIISRTGYTGEDGFELYCAAKDTVQLWKAVLELGKEDGLIPCGLGARDTLRLEAGMPLYGHELNDEWTPIECVLGFFAKLDKPAFIGKDVLAKQKAEGVSKKRVGLVVTGRGIVREHSDVYADGVKVGITTSGTHAPHVGKAIAMAMIEKDKAVVGTALEVDVRGRRVPVEVVKTPFYKREK
ncbi:MAG: glycine cleavage system aminomethyltransferase GcvT [Oscillospiraceae bacterium]|nr:glycine cleavage system aminomethyltransferase GcvT [Oscillospiraceae bacterium]